MVVVGGGVAVGLLDKKSMQQEHWLTELHPEHCSGIMLWSCQEISGFCCGIIPAFVKALLSCCLLICDFEILFCNLWVYKIYDF